MEYPQAPPGGAERGKYHHDLAVYTSKGKAMLWVLLGLASTVMVVIVPWLFSPTDNSSVYRTPLVDLIAQVGGGVVLGGLTIRGLLILFSSAPVFVVSHEGMRVTSLLFTTDTIRWAEVEALVAVGYRTGSYTILNIVLIDRRLVRARQNALQALMYFLYGFPLSWPRAIPVNCIVLSLTVPALLGQIRSHYHQELTQHRIHVRGPAH